MNKQMEYFSCIEKDEITVVFQDCDEYYLSSEEFFVEEQTEDGFLNNFRKQMLNNEKVIGLNSFIDIECIRKEDGQLKYSILSMVFDEGLDKNIFIKKKGKYLRILLDDINDDFDNINKLEAYAKEKDLKLDDRYYNIYLPSNYTEVLGYTEIKIL